MNPSWLDFIDHPVQCLRQIERDNSPLQVYKHVTNYIGQHIDNCEHYNQVPLLTINQSVEEIKDYSLVKYRCLVQDVLSPDYCVEPFPFFKENVGDDIKMDYDESSIDYSKFSDYFERKKYFVTHVPCLNNWVYQQTCDLLINDQPNFGL